LRRSTMALSSSLAAIGLSASIALAQQLSQAPASSSAPVPAPDDSVDPSMAARPTRYLLRNGLDYLAYREYSRALSFFRVVEARQGELNEQEVKQLRNGIAKAQQGLREAVNGAKVVAQPKGRPGVQPGAFALAKPPATASAKAPTDPLLLASAEMPAPPPISQAGMPTLPPSTSPPDALLEPAPAPAPEQAPPGSARPVFGSVGATRVRPTPAPAPAPEVPMTLPEPGQPSTSPEPASTPVPVASPTSDPLALPAQAPSSVELPPILPAPGPAPAPAPVAGEAPPPLVLESSSPSPSPVELPPVVPSGVELPPTVSPPVPTSPEAAPPSVEAASTEPVQPRAAVANRPQDSGEPIPIPIPAQLPGPEPLPAPEAPPAPEAVPMPSASSSTADSIPVDARGGRIDDILPERLRREVELIAQRPTRDQEMPGTAVDPNELPPPVAGSPRLELPRAPSPTEARPLRRIPVPEEFKPLGARAWEPNRKYWAAAGTCHMILYFQDPVLERYGQSVEQSLGPIGRYFSYPLDDPKQSNQRNQILQPFYSIGKFCFQIGTLPYKFVVDPPWEAEYDLGYYRPGDRIPPDTIMITPYGVGPPLKGRQY
jgi:hypothetical protein